MTPVMQVGTVPVKIAIFSGMKQGVYHLKHTIASHTIPRDLIVSIIRALFRSKSETETENMIDAHKEYDIPVVFGYVNAS